MLRYLIIFTMGVLLKRLTMGVLLKRLLRETSVAAAHIKEAIISAFCL